MKIHGKKMPLEWSSKLNVKNPLTALSAYLPSGLNSSSQLFSWNKWIAQKLHGNLENKLSAHLDDLITSVFIF